jgi:ELWxxDGT repeat protein
LHLSLNRYIKNCCIANYSRDKDKIMQTPRRSQASPFFTWSNLIRPALALALLASALGISSPAAAQGPEPYLVRDINQLGSSEPQELIDVNGTLYSTADDKAHGRELWKSDGTEAGTVLVKDLWPGTASSLPFQLTEANGVLYFQAGDSGVELWALDISASPRIYLPLILR